MDNRATRVGEVEQALVPERTRLEELNQKLNGVADEATLKSNESSALNVNEKAKTSLQKLNESIEALEKQLKAVREAPLSSKDPKGYQRKKEISDLTRKLENLKNKQVVE
jgi:small-conductance mechanosensitive channel